MSNLVPLTTATLITRLWRERFWRNWESDYWAAAAVVVFFISFILFLSIGAIKASHDFNRRLAVADRAYKYQSGQNIACNVHPHDDNNRLWIPCKVVTALGKGYYEATWKDPHGGAVTTDTIRVLDMKEKL